MIGTVPNTGWEGSDKNGVDCSAFVQSFMISLYEIEVPRTSKEQYSQSSKDQEDRTKEGDLVFFHTRKKQKRFSCWRLPAQ